MRQFPSLVVLSFAVCAFGCGQSGSTSPSAPSAVAVPAAASSSPTDVTAQAASPPYNASGTWHAAITETVQGGEPFHDEGDSTFTQDEDGTIHVASGNSRITLTRLGPGRGRKIEYKMSLFETHSICNTDLSGNAQIDSLTNTLQATLRGVEQDCAKAELVVTATKTGN